jgi:hypothetical protein
LVLIQARGWILYLVLNYLEDFLVSPAGDDCWYQHLLSGSHGMCHGRVSDFSDHVVLYFAQILPIALTEVLHSFVVPFWSIADNSRIRSMVPMGMLAVLMHLYVITFLGAYKTSAYFHTGPEIFTGYIVSLLVQIPLLLLQCSSLWPRTQEYFFGTSIS